MCLPFGHELKSDPVLKLFIWAIHDYECIVQYSLKRPPNVMAGDNAAKYMKSIVPKHCVLHASLMSLKYLEYLKRKRCNYRLLRLVIWGQLTDPSLNILFSKTTTCETMKASASGGSGIPGAPPLSDQILSFSCNYWQKNCQIIGSLWGWHPLWEILDPPLEVIHLW